MRIGAGSTAFVTGAASGIGLGLAEAFGRRDAQVMLADVEEQALATALQALREKGVECDAIVLDVADRAAVATAARATLARFGRVDVVCNNAGVVVAGANGDLSVADWCWIVGVNLMGVVHGVEAFLPAMRAQGSGHIVNTASVAGLVAAPEFEPYAATKQAVVGMSEGWAAQLAADGIGVSVLCPGFVRSRIHDSARNRPAAAPHDRAPARVAHPGVSGGERAIAADLVGERVIEAIEANELYILTHVEWEPLIAQRFARIDAAFDRAATSALLADRPVQALPDVVRQELIEQGTSA